MTAITTAGLTVSTYQERLAALQAGFQAIYGVNASVDPSTPQGQLLALIAESQSACDQTLAEIYATFDRDTASGNPLSRLGRIAGNIQRIAGSLSTVTVSCVGTPGATINNPIVANSSGTQFSYSGSLTIGGGGSVTSTFTSSQLGAFDVTAQPATIINPQFGWLSATITGGTAGVDYELDPAYRLRLAQSPAGNAQALDDAMVTAIRAIPGITDAIVYDNSGEVTDVNGILPHAIAIVVDGSDGATPSGSTVATTVWKKKAPGPTIQAIMSCNRPDGQASSVAYLVTDVQGTLRQIFLNQVNLQQIYLRIEGAKRAGWVSGASETAIATAIASWTASNVHISDVLYMDDLIPVINTAVPGPSALSALGITSITWGTSTLSSPGSSSPVSAGAFTRTQIQLAHITVVAT